MKKQTHSVREKLLNYEEIQDRVDILKDTYKGEKCYIVGAGPSLKNYDVDYIKDKLTDNETKNADEYFNDKITNELYDNIMSLYQCSLHYDEDKIECAA